MLNFGKSGIDYCLNYFGGRFVALRRFVDRNSSVNIHEDSGLSVFIVNLSLRKGPGCL